MLVFLPVGFKRQIVKIKIGKSVLGRTYEYHLLAIAIAVAIILRGAGALSLDRAIYRLLAGRFPVADTEPGPSFGSKAA